MIKTKLFRRAVRVHARGAAVIILALLAICVYALFVFRLRPLVRELAVAQVNTKLTDLVNRAVMHTLQEQQISFADMVILKKIRMAE